jgi:hypothetical protein
MEDEYVGGEMQSMRRGQTREIPALKRRVIVSTKAQEASVGRRIK